MARSFNGSSDIIDVGQPSVLNFTSNFTLSAWINLTNFPVQGNNHYVIAGKGYDGSKEQYILRISGAQLGGTTDGNTYLMVFYYDGVAAHGFSYAVNGVISFSTWVHVIGSLNTGVPTYALFVNGVAVGGNVATSQVAPTNAAADFTIGGEMVSGSASRFFNGSIADVAAWNTNLSVGNITSLFNGVRPINVNSVNLQGWWPLDGYASPETDLSGNGNNGTLTGTSQVLGPPALWRISG